MITILISTYNGERFLPEQIESLVNQKDVEIQILIRDDGSTDGTISLLKEYKKENIILDWYQGSNLKTAKSFLDLLAHAPDSEYYAFCDQDDVWNNDKLSKAIGEIENAQNLALEEKPILYCSNYQLVDEFLNDLPDNRHVTTTNFYSALVSSCCAGCTVVFNRILKEFLSKKIPTNIVMHDDWAHKVCLALGGIVIYDNTKTIMYRQHGNNVDGGLHSFRHRVIMILKRIKTQDRIRSKQISEILRIYKDNMPDENRLFLSEFIKRYNANIFGRLSLVMDKRLKTYYRRMDFGFKMAVLFHYF